MGAEATTNNAGPSRNLWIMLTIAVIMLSLSAFNVTRRLCVELWDSAGAFIQRQWGTIYDKTEGDPFTLSLLGIVAGNIAFIVVCTLLSIVDPTGKPAILLCYKIQEDKNVPLDPERLKDAIKVAFINQLVFGLPFFWLIVQVSVWRGCDFSRELPSFLRFVFELLVSLLMVEVCFYYSHWLLHHPALYKHIHKKHHEWTAPIGIVALYSHPVEHIFSNLLPVFVGSLLCGSHVFSTAVWAMVALLNTTMAHSGYHFPFLSSPEFHNYHHLKFNQCYGVLGLLDDLHNTSEQFKVTVQYKRHYTLLGTTPVRETYPNVPKDKDK